MFGLQKAKIGQELKTQAPERPHHGDNPTWRVHAQRRGHYSYLLKTFAARPLPDIQVVLENSNDVPYIFGSVTEFAAGDTSRQTVVANGYLLIHVLVGKGISTLSHGTNEDTDALVGRQVRHVVPDAHHGRVKTKGDLATVGRQVISDRVRDDSQEFLLGVGGPNGQAVEKLDHQASKSFESTRNSNSG
jgi:hypothetical protein